MPNISHIYSTSLVTTIRLCPLNESIHMNFINTLALHKRNQSIMGETTVGLSSGVLQATFSNAPERKINAFKIELKTTKWRT